MQVIYHTCPHCGANLDPGERCDCIEKAAPGAGTSESGNANNDGDIVSQKASTRNEENQN